MNKTLLLALSAGLLMSACGKTWSYNAPEDDQWESKPIAQARPSTYEGEEPPLVLLFMKCQPEAKKYADFVIEYAVADANQEGAKDYSKQEIIAKASVLAEETYPITRVGGHTIYFEVPLKSRFGTGTISEAGAMSIKYPVYLKEGGWAQRYLKMRTSGLDRAFSKAQRECRRMYQ